MICGVARSKNCTPAQLALAWVLAQGDDMIPIPGQREKIPGRKCSRADIALIRDELEEIENIVNNHPDVVIVTAKGL